MNDVITAILDRRSIRKYTPEQIPDADRDLIVKAGLFAPSSKNTQAWHITVVQNADIIARITVETKAAILRAGVEKYRALAENPKYTVNYGAPTFMLVAADPRGTSCPVEDCSLVLGNMFLAAHSLGIGSCWINQLGPVTDERVFRKLLTELGVPPDYKIYGCAAFGYGASARPSAPARKENTVNLVR